MTSIGSACYAELRRIWSTPIDLILLTVMPLILLALMAAMIFGGTPSALQVVVVDQDNSDLSREITRNVDVSKAVQIVERTTNIDRAMSLVRSEQAVAVLVIPKGVGTRVADGTPVQILYQAAFLSSGSLASSGIQSAVTATLDAHRPRLEGLAGAAALHPPLPGVQLTILGNPSTSMEWYLGLMLGPAILHLLIAITCVSSLGHVIVDRSFAAFTARTPRLTASLIGRMAPHVVIGTLWGIVWLLWLTLARGYRAEGSLAVIVVGLFLLCVATAAIAMLLQAITRETSTSLSGAVIIAGSALAYSGASLPITGAGRFAEIWSAILPLTHFMTLQMDQVLRTSLWVAAKSAGALLLYLLIAGGLAVLLIRRSGRATAKAAVA